MSTRSENIRFSVYLNDMEAGTTMNSLNTKARQLRSELNKLTLGSREWIDKMRELQTVDRQLKNVRQEINGTTKGIGALADKFNKYFGMMTAGAASITGIVMGFRSLVDTFNAYEKKLDNLSALTGLTGENLEWLSNKAKEMSTSMIEGNIRITQSADAIVDAYTKMGSARPELLKNKEDLHAVTQEAIILSEAANSELQPAVEALAMVLNQFNAPASDSRRIINALAAGSKEGAGEIPYLTTAIEKSGTVAADVNMSYEELIGTIETLAPRMTQPEIAGRSLRGVILKLQGTADETNPSIVGFAKAIENLGNKNMTTSELLKIFGEENITAAKILINNRAETERYTKAVTGTSIALEQAATNTDNNSSKLDQAKNKLQVMSIELGQKLAPALTFSTNSFTYLLKAVVALVDFVPRYSTALIALTGITLAYNAALVKSIALKAIDFTFNTNLIALYIKYNVIGAAQLALIKLKTIWQTRETIATKLAATAQWAWNAAISANPLGLLIASITALVVAIKLYDKYNEESLRLEKERQEAIDRLSKSNYDLKVSYENQNIAIGQLNKLSAEQKRNLYEITKATLNQAAAELVLMEAERNRLKNESSRLSAWQNFVNLISAYSSTGDLFTNVDASKNGEEAVAGMSESIEKLRNQIKLLYEQSNELNNIINAEDIADQITGKSVTQLEEKQRLLSLALKNYEKGTEEYIRIAKKLDLVKKQLDNPDADAEAAKKLEQEKLERYQKTYSAIEDLVRDHQIALMDSDDQEVARIKDKYQKLIDEAKGYNAAIVWLEQLRDAEIQRITAKQDQDKQKKITDFMNEISKLGYDDRDKELDANRQHFDNLVSLAQEYGVYTTETEKNIADARGKATRAIFDKYDKEEDDKTSEDVKKKQDAEQEKQDAIADAAQASFAITANLFGNIAGLMNENSKEYKQWSIAAAIMDTFASAIAAYKSTAEIPIVGPALAPVAAAAALAFGMKQVQIIRNTDTGKYEDGGVFANGGVASGSRHKEGGVHLIDGRSGKKVGEMEGGEPYMILSRKTYANNRNLIDSLLYSSTHLDGAPVDWMQNMPQPNFGMLSQYNSTRTYASGGISNVYNYNTTAPGPSSESNRVESLLTEMLGELRKEKYSKSVIDQDNIISLRDAMKRFEIIENGGKA